MLLWLSVSTVDKIFFTKHLMMLIRSGVTLPESIAIIATQSKSESLKKILNTVLVDIQNASSLGEALSPFTKYFGEFFIKTIQLGEEKGTLEENLKFLDRKLERDFDFTEKIKTASFYPLLLFGTMIILGVIMYLYVIPNLLRLFLNFQTELPPATKVLLFLAKNINSLGPFLLVCMITLIFFLVWSYRLPRVRYVFDTIKIRFPLFGSVAHNLLLAQIQQNLGVLIQIGVSLPEALKVVGSTLTNSFACQELLRMADLVARGNTLADAFAEPGASVFPLLSKKMLALSEKSGTLAATSFYLADFYEREVDRMLSRLTSLLEPILLLAIGGIIAFVAFAILTPIYDLTNIMSNLRSTS